MNYYEDMKMSLSASLADSNPHIFVGGIIEAGIGCMHAITRELDALRSNGAWKIIPRPKNENGIDSSGCFVKKKLIEAYGRWKIIEY